MGYFAAQTKRDVALGHFHKHPSSHATIKQQRVTALFVRLSVVLRATVT
jgi:hypothetical protein